jgi:hypothetical protein
MQKLVVLRAIQFVDTDYSYVYTCLFLRKVNFRVRHSGQKIIFKLGNIKYVLITSTLGSRELVRLEHHHSVQIVFHSTSVITAWTTFVLRHVYVKCRLRLLKKKQTVVMTSGVRKAL